MADKPRPVFLFSLPRAGSTLLQRVLATHSDIATKSEPWLLLPLLYAMKKDGMAAEYGHWVANVALREFADGLVGGHTRYRKEIRNFVHNLYGAACPNQEVYFLDKTPRYHLIVDEIIELFEDAKFIFLWRNPLAIASSISKTWHGGRWMVNHYNFDLVSGFVRLLDARKQLGENAVSIRYEELVSDPEASIKRLLDYLDLPMEVGMLTDFTHTKLVGGMGDETGIETYKTIDPTPLNEWRHCYASRARAAWARRYLRMLGEKPLAQAGYEIDEIRDVLDQNEKRFWSLRDIVDDRISLLSSRMHHILLLSPRFRRLADWNPNTILPERVQAAYLAQKSKLERK